MRCVVMLYWWCTSNASTVFIIFGEMGMSWEARGTWFQRFQYECSKKGGGGDGSLAELYSVRTYAEFLECPEGKYVTQPFQPHIWYSCGGALLLVNMFPSLVWLLGDGSTVGATVVVAGVGDCVGVATGMGAQPAPRNCPPQHSRNPGSCTRGWHRAAAAR